MSIFRNYKQSGLVTWIMAFGLMLALFLFENNTLSGDEVIYLEWALDQNLFSATAEQGKEPFPIWLLKTSLLFSASIEALRVIPLLAAAFALLCMVRIGRINFVPDSVSILIACSSAYFVFYSRIALYEMPLLASCFLMYWGASLYPLNKRRALLLIWFALFFGSLTKASFLIIAMTLPAALILSSLKRPGHPYSRSFRDWAPGLLKDCLISGSGYIVGHLLIALGGQWVRYMDMKSEFSVSNLRAMHNFIARLDYSLEVIVIDLGTGVLAALLLTVIGLAKNRQWLAVALGMAIVAWVFGVASAYPRWLWARYLIVCLPSFVFILFQYFRLSEPRLRSASVPLLIIGQVIAIYLTTLPLLTNPQAALWTEDEVVQHMTGEPGNLGALDVYRKVLAVGETHTLELNCQPDNFQQFFCKYLRLAHPDLFVGDRPRMQLSYIKSPHSLEIKDVVIATHHQMKHDQTSMFQYVYMTK